MKRIMFLTALFLLVYATGVVAAAPILNLDSVVASPASVYPGAPVTFTVTLTNTPPGTDSTGVLFASTGLTNGVTTIVPGSITSLVPGPVMGATVTRTFTINVPSTATAGTYSATLTITDSVATTVTDTLVYTFVVANPLSLSTTTIEPYVEDGEEVEVNFTVTNRGTTALTGLTFSPSILPLDDDDNEITLAYSPASVSTLAAGASTNVVLTFDVENGYEAQDVTSTLVVASAEGYTASVPVTLHIQPLTCEEGIVGELDLTIEEPDSGSDFEQGETVRLEVEVSNNGDDDLDVVLQALLWHVEESEAVAQVESDSENIDEDGDYTFELDLVIDGAIEEGDTYILYVLAYDDGNEDEQCISDSVDVDLEEQDYYLVIDEARATPAVVSCGSNVLFTVDVENQGAHDLDEVFVRVVQDVLGLDVQSESVEINDGDNYVLRVNALIPEDVDSQVYVFDVTADYGELVTEEVSVQVTCDEEPVALPTSVTPSSSGVSVPVTSPATTIQFDEATIFDRLNAGQVPAWFWVAGNVLLAALIVILAIVALGGRRRR